MYCEIINKITLVTTYKPHIATIFCDENFICKAHILYPSIDRLLGCFRVLSIVNSTVMYTGDEVQISL